MSSDMICVYRAADMGEADIVAAWLDDQGITVHVKNRHAAEVLQTPFIIAPTGIEVCVVDPQQAEQANELVREHLQRRKVKANEPGGGRMIETVCEECGKSSRFPFEQRGTVQTCPHCKRYLDVPEAI